MTESAHKKARSSIPFLPDPSKWIQTASGSGSSSATKRAPVQRPLTSLRNGNGHGSAFATPPTTVKRRLEPDGGVAKTQRQESLTGFLTPPPTAVPRRTHATQTVRRARPAPVPLQAHRSAPVTSSSSSSDLGAVSPPRTKRPRRALTSSPEQGVQADLDPDPDLDPVPAPSSDYPSTPVPDHILDIHRRLCGRDSERMKRVRSPWRVFEGGTSSKRKVSAASPSKRRFVDTNQVSRPLMNKSTKRDPNGKNKENADNPLHTQNHTKVKAELKPIPHYTPPRSTATPRKRPVKQPSVQIRSPLGASTAASTRDLSPSAVYRAFRPPSISPPSKQRPLRAGTRTRSPTPGSPTPKKARLAAPALSPPDSALSGNLNLSSPRKMPKADFEPVTMDPETLITWSLGTNPSANKRERPAPVPHDDSGETQSLAPSHASQSFPNLLSSPTRRPPRASASPQEPITGGPEPGNRSMLLPETVARSPVRRGSGLLARSRTSLARFPTDLGVPETIHVPERSPTKHDASPIQRGKSRISLTRLSPVPPQSPSKRDDSPTASASPKKKKKARRSASQWPDQFAIEPGLQPGAASSTTPKPKHSTPTQQPTQSKLAAFGFFSDRPAKPVRGFDEAWDDEEDLIFDHDHDHDPEHAVGHDEEDAQVGLGRVPDPPPHPSLRPAGLRELERRRAAATGLSSESSSSQPVERTSSLTTSSEEVGGSAAAWWDGLGDRRSSEFGSLA